MVVLLQARTEYVFSTSAGSFESLEGGVRRRVTSVGCPCVGGKEWRGISLDRKPDTEAP